MLHEHLSGIDPLSNPAIPIGRREAMDPATALVAVPVGPADLRP